MSAPPTYVAVGQLLRPHGVRGEMRMAILTDFPERLQPGTRVFLGEDYRPVKLLSVRPHQELLLVAFEGYPDRTAVEELRSEMVFVLSSQIPPLPEGEYYQHQLLGLQVFTEDGDLLGRLTEILETGANDVYVIQDDADREILLPALDETILEIDLPAGKMRVHLLPGLIP
ncbi:MAG: ribosome maturation factor RimM [Anaerolineales bacterium]